MTMTSFLRRVPHPDNLNASTLYSVGSFLKLNLKNPATQIPCLQECGMQPADPAPRRNQYHQYHQYHKTSICTLESRSNAQKKILPDEPGSGTWATGRHYRVRRLPVSVALASRPSWSNG